MFTLTWKTLFLTLLFYLASSLHFSSWIGVHLSMSVRTASDPSKAQGFSLHSLWAGFLVIFVVVFLQFRPSSSVRKKKKDPLIPLRETEPGNKKAEGSSLSIPTKLSEKRGRAKQKHRNKETMSKPTSPLVDSKECIGSWELAVS